MENNKRGKAKRRSRKVFKIIFAILRNKNTQDRDHWTCIECSSILYLFYLFSPEIKYRVILRIRVTSRKSSIRESHCVTSSRWEKWNINIPRSSFDRYVPISHKRIDLEKTSEVQKYFYHECVSTMSTHHLQCQRWWTDTLWEFILNQHCEYMNKDRIRTEKDGGAKYITVLLITFLILFDYSCSLFH